MLTRERFAAKPERLQPLFGPTHPRLLQRSGERAGKMGRACRAQDSPVQCGPRGADQGRGTQLISGTRAGRQARVGLRAAAGRR